MTEQTIECIAKYGHLYDAETKERIVFEDGFKCKLFAPHYKPPSEKKVNIKSVDDLAMEVKMANMELRAKNKNTYQKVFDRGKVLYFKLKKPLAEYVFTFVLLEELYVKKTTGYSMFTCHCQTVKSNIPFFESIFGKSLSELYRKTSVIYLGSKTSPEVRAMEDYFYTEPSCKVKEQFKRECEQALFQNKKQRIAEAEAKLKQLKNLAL